MSSIDHLAIGFLNANCVKFTPALAGRAFRAVGAKPRTKVKFSITLPGASVPMLMEKSVLPSPLPAGQYTITAGYEDEPDSKSFVIQVDDAASSETK